MIWLLVSLSFAEPLMTPLSEGEVAPFDGRLFNDEAVVSILTMREFAEEQCDIQKTLDYSLKLAEKDLQIDYLEAEKETLTKRYELLMEIKDNEIEMLRKHVNPRRASWIFFGGFLTGTAASLLTYYSVNQIVEKQ